MAPPWAKHTLTAPQVQVLVRKVRNKAAGQIGDCVFDYDRVTGQYWARDPAQPYLVPQWDQAQLTYYRNGFKGTCCGWALLPYQCGSTPTNSVK